METRRLEREAHPNDKKVTFKLFNTKVQQHLATQLDLPSSSVKQLFSDKIKVLEALINEKGLYFINCII